MIKHTVTFDFDNLEEAKNFEKIASRCLKMEAAIKWVITDASYKAPESMDVDLADRWVETLQKSIK